MQGIKDQKSAAFASAAAPDTKDQKVSAAAKFEPKHNQTLEGHNSAVRALTVLPDGGLASGSGEGSFIFTGVIKLWDLQSKRCVQTLTGHSEHIYALTVLPDGRLASGSLDNNIKLWDVKTGKCVQTLRGHSDSVNALTLLDDGRLASGSSDKSIKLWDVCTGKCAQTLQGHSNDVNVLTMLADSRLASGSKDHNIKLWDVKMGKCVQTLEGHSLPVSTLTVLSDDRLASGSYDDTIKLWSLKTGKCELTLSEAVDVLTVLPDGRLVNGFHNSITLLNLQTMERVHTNLSGPSERVHALIVLPDGHLASGFGGGFYSRNNGIRLWDVGTKQLLQLQAAAQLKAKEEAKLKAEREAKEKELADLRAQVEQMKLQQNKPVNPHPVSPTPVVAQPIDLFEQFAVSRIQPTKPTIPTEAITVSLNINYKDIKLGDEIGKGGFGIVYRGTWKYNQVAVKQLLAAPTGDALKDFKEEMQTHASLRSDHIVQLYGCCLGPYCMVMQYMPRGSLSNYLKEHRTKDLDWNIGYKIITDMACGLAFLHDNEIVHRDLKSLNVLLDENYNAKLSDFGLAKIKHESKTMLRYGGSAGTTAWMAPELFARKAGYTKKADIYSLGITFWEIAARKIPFEDAADPSIIPTWVKDGEREEIPASCPPKLASLIKFCWHGKPEERPTAARIVEYLRSDEKEFSLSSKTNNIAAVTATAVSTPFFAASYQANSNAAKVNNLASASFPASYQMNTPAVKK